MFLLLYHFFFLSQGCVWMVVIDNDTEIRQMSPERKQKEKGEVMKVQEKMQKLVGDINTLLLPQYCRHLNLNINVFFVRKKWKLLVRICEFFFFPILANIYVHLQKKKIYVHLHWTLALCRKFLFWMVATIYVKINVNSSFTLSYLGVDFSVLKKYRETERLFGHFVDENPYETSLLFKAFVFKYNRALSTWRSTNAHLNILFYQFKWCKCSTALLFLFGIFF